MTRTAIQKTEEESDKLGKKLFRTPREKDNGL